MTSRHHAHYGRLLQRLLDQLSMSPAELAALLNLPMNSITDWGIAQDAPWSPRYAHEIAEKLGTARPVAKELIDDFLSAVGYQPVAARSNVGLLDRLSALSARLAERNLAGSKAFTYGQALNSLYVSPVWSMLGSSSDSRSDDLIAHLIALLEEPGTLVLLHGEPGVGKTIVLLRLFDELLHNEQLERPLFPVYLDWSSPSLPGDLDGTADARRRLIDDVANANGAAWLVDNVDVTTIDDADAGLDLLQHLVQGSWVLSVRSAQFRQSLRNDVERILNPTRVLTVYLHRWKSSQAVEYIQKARDLASARHHPLGAQVGEGLEEEETPFAVHLDLELNWSLTRKHGPVALPPVRRYQEYAQAWLYNEYERERARRLKPYQKQRLIEWLAWWAYRNPRQDGSALRGVRYRLKESDVRTACESLPSHVGFLFGDVPKWRSVAEDELLNHSMLERHPTVENGAIYAFPHDILFDFFVASHLLATLKDSSLEGLIAARAAFATFIDGRVALFLEELLEALPQAVAVDVVRLLASLSTDFQQAKAPLYQEQVVYYIGRVSNARDDALLALHEVAEQQSSRLVGRAAAVALSLQGDGAQLDRYVRFLLDHPDSPEESINWHYSRLLFGDTDAPSPDERGDEFLAAPFGPDDATRVDNCVNELLRELRDPRLRALRDLAAVTLLRFVRLERTWGVPRPDLVDDAVRALSQSNASPALIELVVAEARSTTNSASG